MCHVRKFSPAAQYLSTIITNVDVVPRPVLAMLPWAGEINRNSKLWTYSLSLGRSLLSTLGREPNRCPGRNYNDTPTFSPSLGNERMLNEVRRAVRCHRRHRPGMGSYLHFLSHRKTHTELANGFQLIVSFFSSKSDGLVSRVIITWLTIPRDSAL